ncbi:DNA-(apurinic or apyrimidinic site) lyase 2 [Boleophthalmus pectinirostris]|uniref:DNA-(apurinic or apyrimidinic site) lyase 2 n=1 Tax=Boleophthalmus pectinirostris TaxID=150288 RepID=UPI000A1C5780|nr:DNA-(apurinic or apyrimidinic site) lyase 2 [Boleophthalmus pectinirostris]
MKIVTWNINGIRTFRSGIKKALDSLDADIICVQETKVTRDLLDERTAIVDGYNSYFSYSRGRSGYSGVATYCKDQATPCAAEEGLTGLLTSHDGAVKCYGDHAEFSNEELQLLDNEGRAVITQHRITCQGGTQLITVINVYCPRADPEKPERKQFKLQFYKLLQSRAEAILKSGSHVIVLGDVNTSHRPIDHCDPSEIDDFEENPGRKWLNGFLHCNQDDQDRKDEDMTEEHEAPLNQSGGGKFVDMFRFFHSTRPNAFTCWSTMTGARQTNYGTRIDYIFADCQLAKDKFVAADIMPEVEGSDHCPVWGQLSCTLLPNPKPPPFCTQYLPEFAGKQQKLSRFLVKMDQKIPQPSPREELPLSQEEEERRENVNPSGRGEKRPADSALPKGKKTKTTKPQGNLLAFFKPKTVNVVSSIESTDKRCENNVNQGEVNSIPKPLVKHRVTDTAGVCSSSASKEDRHTIKVDSSTSQFLTPTSDAKKGSVFWKSVLKGPPPAPCCKIHGEPCVLRTVKKEGPNIGKQFFVCARPQGHASNPEARCNFFAWVEKK